MSNSKLPQNSKTPKVLTPAQETKLKFIRLNASYIPYDEIKTPEAAKALANFWLTLFANNRINKISKDSYKATAKELLELAELLEIKNSMDSGE